MDDDVVFVVVRWGVKHSTGAHARRRACAHGTYHRREESATADAMEHHNTQLFCLSLSLYLATTHSSISFPREALLYERKKT